jgi:DeoR/GlpR family transcriptional regulator of sugar metabolism
VPASEAIVVRNAENIDRKAALGGALAELVTKRQFVFIDCGTTNLAAARMIPKNFDLTVTTQDPAMATSDPFGNLLMVGHEESLKSTQNL